MSAEQIQPSVLEAELYRESLIRARSLLVIDICDQNTRAVLFDAVDNHYRLIAASSKMFKSTTGDQGIIHSVQAAINEIELITNRELLSADRLPILPTRMNGSGLDDLIVTLSMSNQIRILLGGLVDELSVSSAEILAHTTYSKILAKLNLQSIEDLLSSIESIVITRPDLIIITGGTEGGAEEPLLKLLESIRMGCELESEPDRPVVLFAGNQMLHDRVIQRLEGITDYHLAANVQPSINRQDIAGAHIAIAETTVNIRCQQDTELSELSRWAGEHVYHTPAAFSRLIRFLAEARSSGKGVFGVNIDPHSASYAASFGGDLSMGVHPELGLGNLPRVLIGTPGLLDEIIRWLPVEIPSDTVHAYLLNKHLYPDSIPATEDDLQIERAAARIILMKLLDQYSRTESWSRSNLKDQRELPPVEPIIAGGRVITEPDDPVSSILVLLDGLQPRGATTLVLDPHQIFAMLGAAAGLNPALSIQVLNSKAFIHLGTVISPTGRAKSGSPILRAKIEHENGGKIPVELLYGDMLSIPLSSGRSARMELHPLQNFDIGMGGAGVGGSLLVKGGSVGIVFDGRGRPFLPPDDPEQRSERYRKWEQGLGG
jgi:hypothetical protein